jgi:UDP:flavonoid glycosyltransferase YjiC (YdhE family)
VQDAAMRFLFSSTPEYSHLAPLIPLALELQQRGHEVRVAGCPKLGEFAAQAGLPAVRAGLDADPDRLAESITIRPPPELPLTELHDWAVGAVFVETFAAALVDDLRRIAEEWRPDVLVRDTGEYAAWIVGEALDAPVATVTFGRLPDPEFLVQCAGEAFAALRRAHGLPPDPDLSTLFDGIVLVPAPASYADAALPVLPSVSFVQPMTHDTTGDEGLPSWVSGLGSRPVVYVTLGNILNNEDAFRPFLDALAHDAVDLILTVGRAVDPDVFRPVADNVHIERYIPQSLLLPAVDVVVCHAGFNTVIAALTLGIPLVLAPISADQPEHARSCAALGVARVINSGSDPDAIRAATRTVLDEPAYRDAARRVQREIAALPNIQDTADLVEQAPQVRSTRSKPV